MKYDSVLCMNVPESKKARDAESAKLEELYNAAKEFERGLKVLKSRGSAAGYVEAMQRKYDEAKKKYRAAGGTKSFDTKTIDKAIRACDDLKSDKEKALAEYKKAKADYEKVSENAKTLAEFKALSNTQEFKAFKEAERVCKLLGCIL